MKVDTSGNGTVVSTGGVTLSLPKGVALDQSGNLFIADTGNNRIVEVTSGGSAAALAITVSSGSATLSAPHWCGGECQRQTVYRRFRLRTAWLQWPQAAPPEW